MESCTCVECQSACLHDPGRFLPGQTSRLAAFFQISQEELYKKYLILKHLKVRGRTIWVPAPAKLKSQRPVTKPGHKARDHHENESGRCIFLTEDGRCSIQDAKPYECGAYMGCKHTFQGRPYKDSAVEDYFFSKWKGFQSELPELPQA